MGFSDFELPSAHWHYIPAEKCFHVQDVRHKIMKTECALCGTQIIVRCDEHPYIRHKGNLLAFFCKSCDPLFIDIGQSDGKPREHFTGLWDR